MEVSSRPRRVLWGDQRGFTLVEVMITVVIIGIVMAIATSTYNRVIEGRQVDSATNQLVADMRLAHTSATNRLESWQVVLTSGSSTYQVGKTGALSTRDFCGEGGCSSGDPKVTFSGGSPVTITFNSDGSASSSVTAFEVAIDGISSHDLELTPATSRIKID